MNMTPRIVVAGAGIIGASIAANLSMAGAQVTVIDAGMPASGASGRSFGWINASFFVDDAHHRLRAAGIEAYRRLTGGHPGLAVAWPGCLWWEEQGDGLEDMERRLRGFGYPVERVGRRWLETQASYLGDAPDEALVFPNEGVVEAGKLTRQLLSLAQDNGAQVVLGCPVAGLETGGGQVSGVRCEGGILPADRVIIAAGNGCPDLMKDIGASLPMLRRPGALLYTRPIDPLLDMIMVSPELEFRQDDAGRIIAPSSASHQGDETETLSMTADQLADDTLARLRRLLPGVDLRCERMTLAMRPVPGDGLPVVGACGPEGAYLAVMHSGVTLAALMGELVRDEVIGGTISDRLSPYRPQRFQARQS